VRFSSKSFRIAAVRDPGRRSLRGWPPDDNIENHRDELKVSGYAADVDSDVPSPLVLKAPAMGWPI
jgi:hypothetical protein